MSGKTMLLRGQTREVIEVIYMELFFKVGVYFDLS